MFLKSSSSSLSPFLCVHPPAPRGVRSRRRRPAGWGAQHSRRGRFAEGVPQGHARPSSNQGALHSFHQHHMWASFPVFLWPRSSFSLPPPPLFFNQAIPTCVAVLDHDEQQNVTQLLIYLLPACNSDTLHRLLEFLSTVTDHANDRQDKDGQEVKPRSFLSNIK